MHSYLVSPNSAASSCATLSSSMIASPFKVNRSRGSPACNREEITSSITSLQSRIMWPGGWLSCAEGRGKQISTCSSFRHRTCWPSALSASNISFWSLFSILRVRVLRTFGSLASHDTIDSSQNKSQERVTLFSCSTVDVWISGI
jgi:hypothetical protein